MDSLNLGDPAHLSAMRDGNRKGSVDIKGNEWLYELEDDPQRAQHALTAVRGPADETAPVSQKKADPPKPTTAGSGSVTPDPTSHTVMVNSIPLLGKGESPRPKSEPGRCAPRWVMFALLAGLLVIVAIIVLIVVLV
eukprot:NODE_7929_length_733_cov_105.677049_g7677_i0.p1 GENE.NODE_7929_length_733_cov_105.677049_g7677_i0~~NODE_7929_length_733_cov_105.677049_g7677_i0.p1  ORF type:complete len:137 (-),score=9.80 NODE_7929_length_733_cov_105.677049_g7677_i0:166-576(-)